MELKRHRTSTLYVQEIVSTPRAYVEYQRRGNCVAKVKFRPTRNDLSSVVQLLGAALESTQIAN
jgi:hypothetical protein